MKKNLIRVGLAATAVMALAACGTTSGSASRFDGGYEPYDDEEASAPEPVEPAPAPRQWTEPRESMPRVEPEYDLVPGQCLDITSYDYDWSNDVVCMDWDGSIFYTDYEGADAFLGNY